MFWQEAPEVYKFITKGECKYLICPLALRDLKEDGYCTLQFRLAAKILLKLPPKD